MTSNRCKRSASCEGRPKATLATVAAPANFCSNNFGPNHFGLSHFGSKSPITLLGANRKAGLLFLLLVVWSKFIVLLFSFVAGCFVCSGYYCCVLPHNLAGADESQGVSRGGWGPIAMLSRHSSPPNGLVLLRVARSRRGALQCSVVAP